MAVDELDKKILAMLKTNSRTSNVEIAKAIGMTEGAVRKRIDHLLKQKTIKRFTIDISEDQNLFAIVMLKAKHETKKMMADLLELDHPRESYEISGEYDGCVVVEGSSLDEIDKKIDKIRKLSSVLDTRTFISLKKW